MPNKIILKKSSVTSKVPTTGDLVFGELALNYTDGVIYYKDSNNQIQSVGSIQSTPLSITTTTASTSTNSGAVIISGGLGVGQTIWATQLKQTSTKIAIGGDAGTTNQGDFSVALGAGAGFENQSTSAIGIGTNAGQTGQGSNSVAVGYNAGQSGQGASAVAIGQNAGDLNQPANSIIINASGASLNGSQASLYISPIRADASSSGTTFTLFYNPTTKEITTSSAVSNFNGGTITDPLTINNTTDASSTATGALIVTGGVGVGGRLYAGNIYSNGTQLQNFNTGTLVTQAVSAITATSAAIAYSLANTGSTYVGRATLSDLATTSTSAATAYSLANTGTTYVGRAALADTATNAATAYSLANTGSTYVGRAVLADSATTATSAATAYSWTGGTVANATTFNNSTESTSTYTGAVVIKGGLGVAGDIHSGGDFHVIGTGTYRFNDIDILNYDDHVWYVSDGVGNDTLHNGHREWSAFRTIKKALSVADAGDTILILPGSYEEEFPLTIPAGVSVRGAGLRECYVYPTTATNTQTAFLLNGETTISDFTVGGFYKPGWAFKFAPNAKVTTRSPYIERFSVLTRGSVTTNTDPYGFDAGDAGNGAQLDASLMDPTTLQPTMLFNEATFIVPNATALYMTNGARSEVLNTFVYFADKAFHTKSGTAGLGGVGKTRLKLGGVTGTFTTGTTLTYRSNTGTVLATGTIVSTASGYIYLDGPRWGFETATDAGTSTQQVFVAGGATATSITLADYHQFGAEIRSIGSAAVFGTQGVIADGTGTDLKLIAFNMSYIGSGKDLSNDATLATQVNEIIEINGGIIDYQTVDHLGDFRVGKSFYVNQRNGTVSFGTSTVNLTTLTSLTITDGINSSNITPTSISVGSLALSGSSLITNSGNLTIAPSGSLTTVNSNLQANGTFNASGVTSLTNTANATSTNTGALQVSGGIGVGRDIFVGGSVTATQLYVGPWAVSTGSATINTTTLYVARAVLADTATTATSAATAYSTVAALTAGTGLTGSTFNGSTAVTWTLNTATLMAQSVTATNAFIATTATSAATAYALASTGTTYVGRAVLADSATTATSAATAYSTVAALTAGTGLTGSTFNGSTAVTWTLNTATLMAQAVFATTATSAGLAYDWTGGTVDNNSLFLGNVEIDGQTTLASTTATTFTATSVTATTISDGIGNVRTIPQNSQASTYTLQASDNGKHISAAGVITVPPNVFAIGANVMIYNSTASNLSITTGTNQGLTMWLAGSASQGARTLAQRGLATLVFVTTNTIVISGAGLT